MTEPSIGTFDRQKLISNATASDVAGVAITVASALSDVNKALIALSDKMGLDLTEEISEIHKNISMLSDTFKELTGFQD